MAKIDFKHSPSEPRLGWILLLAGLACVIAASMLNSRYEEVRDSAASALEGERELANQRARPAPVVAPTQAETRAQSAFAESSAPVLATLRAIERTAQDPIYLRTLTVDPAGHAIKLEAEAPTFADALAYIQTLDAEPLLHPAILTTHNDVPEQITGKTHLNFSVMAQWNRR